METLTALAIRKSCRCYLDRKVEADKLEALLAAADQAPKSGELRIFVVENAAFLQELNDLTLAYMADSENSFLQSRAALPGYQPLYGAPLLVLLAAGADDPLGLASASCAAANLTIAATQLELGSCYVISPIVPLRQSPRLLAKLGLTEEFAPMCGVLLGYSGGEKFAAPKTAANPVIRIK